MKVGFYDSNLDPGSQSALTESMKLWIETVKKHAEYKPLTTSIVETKFYTSNKELYSDILNKSLDLMNLTAWDFLKYHLDEKVAPIVVASLNEHSKFEKYYLVAKKGANFDELSSSSNVQISIPKSNSSYLINAWLKVELTEKLGQNKFKTITILETDQNENQTLLAIFFKKTGLTVVREGAYLTACELNPQIKKGTSIITASDNYVNYFMAERKGLDPAIHHGIIKESLKLPFSVEGKQMLDIMRTEKVFELRLDELKETERLFKKYNKLSK